MGIAYVNPTVCTAGPLQRLRLGLRVPLTSNHRVLVPAAKVHGKAHPYAQVSYRHGCKGVPGVGTAWRVKRTAVVHPIRRLASMRHRAYRTLPSATPAGSSSRRWSSWATRRRPSWARLTGSAPSSCRTCWMTTWACSASSSPSTGARTSPGAQVEVIGGVARLLLILRSALEVPCSW